MSEAWLQYENSIPLGEYDGEMRLHDDGEGNIFLLCWRAERESGEMRRDTEYDGSLGPPQIEALRKLLNERAGESQALPALAPEGIHPSVFIREELDERGWGFWNLVNAFGGDGVDVLALQMYFAAAESDELRSKCRLGELSEKIARGFGTSPELFANLERSWVATLGRQLYGAKERQS